MKPIKPKTAFDFSVFGIAFPFLEKKPRRLGGVSVFGKFVGAERGPRQCSRLGKLLQPSTTW